MATNAPTASEAPKLNRLTPVAEPSSKLTEKQHHELGRINRNAKVVGWTPTPIVQMPNGSKMLLLPNGEWLVA